jgi:hypothetical protein
MSVICVAARIRTAAQQDTPAVFLGEELSVSAWRRSSNVVLIEPFLSLLACSASGNCGGSNNVVTTTRTVYSTIPYYVTSTLTSTVYTTSYSYATSTVFSTSTYYLTSTSLYVSTSTAYATSYSYVTSTVFSTSTNYVTSTSLYVSTSTAYTTSTITSGGSTRTITETVTERPGTISAVNGPTVTVKSNTSSVPLVPHSSYSSMHS